MHELPVRPVPPRSLLSTAMEWMRWVGLARLVAVAIAIAAVGAGGYWLLRAPTAPVESALPFASATTTTVASPSAATAAPVATVPTATSVPETAPLPATVVVDVAGAVLVPAVYELPIGSRVTDAIAAAGGLTADADTDVVNLAAAIRDGDRVYVPRVGQPVPIAVGPTGGVGSSGSGADGADGGPPVPVDLNTASVEALDALPGVGPSTAAAIVDHRERDGPFLTVDDLLDVRGIGPAKLDAIRDLVTV